MQVQLQGFRSRDLNVSLDEWHESEHRVRKLVRPGRQLRERIDTRSRSGRLIDGFGLCIRGLNHGVRHRIAGQIENLPGNHASILREDCHSKKKQASYHADDHVPPMFARAFDRF